MILNLVDCVESLFSLRRQKRLREGGETEYSPHIYQKLQKNHTQESKFYTQEYKIFNSKRYLYLFSYGENRENFLFELCRKKAGIVHNSELPSSSCCDINFYCKLMGKNTICAT